jgi:hypothetical protein
MAPVIFRRYAARGVEFTREPWARRAAAGIRVRFDALLGEDKSERAVFFGRIGEGRAAHARSLRLPLEQLRSGTRSGVESERVMSEA